MSDLLSRRLAQLGEPANLSLLGECLHGIERECLRVDRDGQLALTEVLQGDKLVAKAQGTFACV